MTAAETIAAAIEKLEHERNEATPGEWYVTYEKSRWPRVWGNRDENDADAVAQTEGGVANAHLIATLHRTIDVQLEWLKREHMLATEVESYVPFAYTVALARAILGEES